MTETATPPPPVPRQPLPGWVVTLTFAGGLFSLLLMGTGGGIAPWAFGFGGLVLLALLLPAAAWALPRAIRLQEDRLAWVLWLGVAFLSCVALQLVPVPPAWLNVLSPRGAAIRRDFGGWDGVSWQPISLAPSLTVQTLTVWLVGFVVFVTTLLTVRSNHLRRFAMLIALGTGAWALYGLVIFVVLDRSAAFKPFGVPLLPGRATGPSVNPNRFAYVLEMGLPFCLLLFKAELDRIELPRGMKFRARLHSYLTDRRVVLGTTLWGVISMLVGTAMVLTLSRGGISACIISLVIGFALLHRLQRTDATPRARWTRRSWINLLIVVVVMLFCLGVGLDQTWGRFRTLFSENASRWRAWRAMLPMAGDFLRTGAGAGTFRDVFSVYQPADLPYQYRYAHNEYLNLLLDLGLGGLAMGLAFVAFWFRTAWRKITAAQPEPQRWRLGVLVGLLAVAMHQIGDFGLQDPAVLWHFSLLLGLGLCPTGVPGAGASMEGSSRRRRRRSQMSEDALAEPLPAVAPVESVAMPTPAPVRTPARSSTPVWVLQGLFSISVLGALTALVCTLPLTWADWIRPGSLWVHIDWLKGGVGPTTAATDLEEWETGWQRAMVYAPADPVTNYQAATAVFYELYGEVADQPLLAPSLQQSDGTIRLIRCQTPREWTTEQQARIQRARAWVETALAGSATRPEYHLLRLRLAVLGDDLAVVHSEIPRVAALYGGVPDVLAELQTILVYEYQRGATALSPEAFQALRRDLLTELLVLTKGVRAGAPFALNRGVALDDFARLMPPDPASMLELADYLRENAWYKQAMPFYLQLAELPVGPDGDPRPRHRAMGAYLEMCLRTQQYDEFRHRLPGLLQDTQDYEKLEYLRDHVMILFRSGALDAELLQNLGAIFLALPPFSRDGVETVRLQVLGSVAFQNGDLDEAKRWLEQAHDKSRNAQVLSQLAQIAQLQGDYLAGARYCGELLDVVPGSRTAVLRQQARFYWLGHDDSNAAGVYRQLMSTDPDHRAEYAARVGELSGDGGHKPGAGR